MAKLYYKLTAIGQCKTPCPKGKTIGDNQIMIGSSYCNNICKYFIKDDERNQIVECSYKEHNNG